MVVLLGIMAIFISFSRSAWLVGGLVGLWLLATHFLKKERKNILLRSNKLCLLPIACCLLSAAVLATLLLIKLPFSTDESISQRLQLIKVASLIIQTAPLIGFGLNNFIIRLPEFWQDMGWTYWLQPVHNIYLLVAAETGIVGLVIFLWFLALTYKRKRLFRKLCPMPYVLCPSLTAILLLGLFDHYWLTLQQTQLLFTIVLGFAWAKAG
jgi:O-antigen ligase